MAVYEEGCSSCHAVFSTTLERDHHETTHHANEDDAIYDLITFFSLRHDALETERQIQDTKAVQSLSAALRKIEDDCSKRLQAHMIRQENITSTLQCKKDSLEQLNQEISALEESLSACLMAKDDTERACIERKSIQQNEADHAGRELLYERAKVDIQLSTEVVEALVSTANPG